MIFALPSAWFIYLITRLLQRHSTFYYGLPALACAFLRSRRNQNGGSNGGWELFVFGKRKKSSSATVRTVETEPVLLSFVLTFCGKFSLQTGGRNILTSRGIIKLLCTRTCILSFLLFSPISIYSGIYSL